MNTAEALRQLLHVVRSMDLEDEAKRPTEEVYQAAIVQAELALQIHDEGLCSVCGRGPHLIDDPECKPLRLRNGALVDLRAPWPTPVPAVGMKVTVPGQAEPIAEWQRDAKGKLIGGDVA